MGFDDVEVIANINEEERVKFKESIDKEVSKNDNKEVLRVLKGKWYKFRGNITFNQRSNDYEQSINDIEELDKVTEAKIVDDAEEKRVELHNKNRFR